MIAADTTMWPKPVTLDDVVEAFRSCGMHWHTDSLERMRRFGHADMYLRGVIRAFDESHAVCPDAEFVRYQVPAIEAARAYLGGSL